MMMYSLVGLGAVLGAWLRYWIGHQIKVNSNQLFPWATFGINLSGSLVLGLIAGLQIGGPMYALLGTGVMGGYTTFSTFNREIWELWLNKKYQVAVIYFLLSYVLGLLLGLAGYGLGRYL